MHPRLHDPRRRSAPKAAATADVSHLVEQGLVQSLGVFIDTLVICSATAFVILFDRSCTSRTREAREEAVAPTAFRWATQTGTTPNLSFRAVVGANGKPEVEIVL
jgi:Na+/alanine symporter